MAKTILVHASELVTCSGFRAKCGSEMKELTIIEDGAILIENGMITAVGTTEELFPFHKDAQVIDCTGKAVLPGFVDSHTHFVFDGYRAEEFSWRLKGESYMGIMLRGGGIQSTTLATRAASKDCLAELGRKRLASMLSLGVTTVEGKSGYGLDLDTEIKQLEVMRQLKEQQPVDIVPTFMGAHSVPMEYKGDPDGYINFIINRVLPVVAEKKLAEFCDVFCEANVFDLEQSRKLLLAGEKYGMKPKLHADEIVSIGGTALAARLGAVSADHLLHASEEGISLLAEKKVVATLLPATAFSLKEPYAKARRMIDRGCAVALASDFNPGSCFTNSIPLLFALATIYMDMTIEETVTAMTINGAAALNRADRIGSIDPGKIADLIVLEYPSYQFLHYHIGMNIVEKVIKRGKLVYDKCDLNCMSIEGV
ncbi:MAG: imidazolonepropionase [Eubacteriales bacterium]|nr:imidazolonepropionase [Eubacteriales bacterium]